jgi:GT2 family glycosyltransferase
MITSAKTPISADVSVVVCSYSLGRWNELRSAVSSLQAQTCMPREIIVVVDHNAELLERARATFIAPVRVIENDGERGLSDARNAGVAAAGGAIIAFLDDDAVADRQWLAQILRHYDNQSVVGVGGSALPNWVSGRPRWFPEEFDWVVGCAYRGMPTQLSVVRNLLGCNMSFRRSAFSVGGFDPRIGRIGGRPVGCEETEFCIRLTQARPGNTILYEPAATVIHRVSADRGSWRYFRSRCYSEGISKALVSRLVGRTVGLESERRHAMRTLPAGVARSVMNAVRGRDRFALSKVAAIIAGLSLTAVGYLAGTVSLALRRPRMRRPA